MPRRTKYRCNLLTTLECIFRESVLGVEDTLEADESPAAGEMRWFGDVAAAIGSEKRERKRVEVARRKVEANTLAAGASSRGVHGWPGVEGGMELLRAGAVEASADVIRGARRDAEGTRS